MPQVTILPPRPPARPTREALARAVKNVRRRDNSSPILCGLLLLAADYAHPGPPLVAAVTAAFGVAIVVGFALRALGDWKSRREVERLVSKLEGWR
jgi:hypothetical protein